MFGIFWNELLNLMQKHMLITDQERGMLKVVSSAQEVLDYIKSLEG